VVFFTGFLCSPVFSKSISANVMAPLAVGDIRNPNAASETDAWKDFERQLDEAKKIGVLAVTTDIWWGVVEQKENVYRWEYYDKLANVLRRKQLKWIPILSFHQCGGNVGDECYFPIPKWIWSKYVGKPGVTDSNSIKYTSEYGHTTEEVVSVWATRYVIDDYERFIKEFQKHFSGFADDIEEINVSLGASGELRYPSFNAHDPKAGYPSRGALQSYSAMAVDDFRNWSKSKYSTLENLNRAWGFNLSSWSGVYPPSDLGPPDASTGFFSRGEHFSQYGKDFFDWYQHSLLEHGRVVMERAIRVFNSPGAGFAGIDIGAKIPGIHWRSASDRLAELAGGMIRTSGAAWDDDKTGRGYSPLIRLFKDLGSKTQAPTIQLHYTCLEKANGEDGDWAKSLAKALVFWVGAEAKRQNVSIKGENALAGPMGNDSAWDNIVDALTWSHYSGITILRLQQVVDNPVGKRRFQDLVSRF
jgi:beta-amylase